MSGHHEIKYLKYWAIVDRLQRASQSVLDLDARMEDGERIEGQEWDAAIDELREAVLAYRESATT